MREDIFGTVEEQPKKKKNKKEPKPEVLDRKGHRQRVKEEVLNRDGRGISEHHLIEYLLFFCIPQKDTKPIAYDLINMFGNLYGICNAQPSQLLSVKGMTRDAVVFFRSFDALFDLYASESGKQQKLEGISGVLKYMRRIVSPGVETCYIINLTDKDEIYGIEKIAEGTVNSLDIPINVIVKAALNSCSRRIILMHTHPSGQVAPSDADKAATYSLCKIFRALDIQMVDHIILYQNFALSMKEHKLYRLNKPRDDRSDNSKVSNS